MTNLESVNTNFPVPVHEASQETARGAYVFQRFLTLDDITPERHARIYMFMFAHVFGKP